MNNVTDSHETAIAILEQEFASLDGTVIRALAADVDPLQSLQQLRELLSILAAETQNDDFDGSFDPSGMGGTAISTTAVEGAEQKSTTESRTTSQNSAAPSIQTRTTSDEIQSHGAADTDQYKQCIAPMVHLGDAEKVQKLQVMFPGEPAARIEFLLHKAHGDFTQTLDTLLNQTFMASETPGRGIDAFLEEVAFAPSASKKKARKDKHEKSCARGAKQLEISTAMYKKPEADVNIPIYHSTKHNHDPKGRLRATSPFLSASDASLACSDSVRKAHAAYRNPSLGRFAGAAASYYHAEASARRQNADLLSRDEAERLVSASASPGQIDLHGVSVHHATEIAALRTQSWWDQIDDQHKFAGHLRGQNEFRIITGVGNHSVGGVGKLGPAVSRRLLAEGWKVSIGRGFVCVTGPARGR